MPYAHSPKSHKWEMAEVGFTLGPSDSNGSLIDFFFFLKNQVSRLGVGRCKAIIF